MDADEPRKRAAAAFAHAARQVGTYAAVAADMADTADTAGGRTRAASIIRLLGVEVVFTAVILDRLDGADWAVLARQHSPAEAPESFQARMEPVVEAFVAGAEVRWRMVGGAPVPVLPDDEESAAEE